MPNSRSTTIPAQIVNDEFKSFLTEIAPKGGLSRCASDSGSTIPLPQKSKMKISAKEESKPNQSLADRVNSD
jgi:hypothetical protein